MVLFLDKKLSNLNYDRQPIGGKFVQSLENHGLKNSSLFVNRCTSEGDLNICPIKILVLDINCMTSSLGLATGCVYVHT